MRLGSYEIKRFQEDKPLKAISRPKPEWRKEIGGTGTSLWRGFLDEDYNSNLKGTKWYATVDKMRHGDAQVQATLLAIQLPIRSAKWMVKPASEDKIDIDIAKTIENNLKGGMVQSWDDFLRQALLYLAYGSMAFEKIFDVKDGLWVWHKYATRMPDTFYRYNVEQDTEELVSVEQQVHKANKWKIVDIPADRLILFINELEGANYKGWSILRSAYKHWYFKEQYYKLHGIAMERHGVGTPEYKQTQEGSFDEDTLMDILEAYRAHEKGGLVTPYGYEFNIRTPEGGTLTDPLPMVEHHDRLITQSILAHFLNLGQTGVGSYALSTNQKDLFLMALQAVTNYFCEKMNGVIHELVDINWNVRGNYPELIVENLQSKDLLKLASGLALLSKAGLLTPGAQEIEEWVRKIWDLPDIPEDQVNSAFDYSSPDTIELQSTATFKPWRELRPEEKFLDLDGIYDKLTGSEQDFTKIAKELRRKQIKIMLARGLKALLKKKDIEFYDAVDKIKVPFWNDMKKELQTVLKSIYQYGKEQVKEEIGRQKTKQLQGEEFEPVEGDVASNRYLNKLAERSTEEINKGLLAGLAFGLYRLHSQGSTDTGALRQRLETLSDREIKKASGYSVSSAFNMGRRTGVKKEIADGEPIEKAVYSAILDGNTCGSCAQVDGREVEVGSAEYEDIYPPLNSAQYQCEGGGRCRCVMIFLVEKKAA